MLPDSGPFLNVATFCEKVIQSKSGVLSLINVVDQHNVMASGPGAPDKMPKQTINWTLVLTFRSGAARGSKQVKITPEDPSSKDMRTFEVPVRFEGRNRGSNVVLELGFEVEIPGVYWFRVELDGEFVTKIPIEVTYGRTVVSA
ncbi:MAG: hypothetical protein O3C10_11665 [Chloroflexi bacterium]|nr:hypothetical protein [Chloroflexota bacterium]